MTTQNKTVPIHPAYKYEIRPWLNHILRRISTSTKTARAILDQEFKTQLNKTLDTIDKQYGAIPYNSEKQIAKIPSVELGFLNALVEIFNKYLPPKFQLTGSDLINYKTPKTEQQCKN